MNFKKLLTLSAAALMVGTTAVGCGPTSSSEPAPEVNVDELMSDAAGYLWQLYRNKDDQTITGTFDVVNRISVGSEFVNITWTLEATGATNAFELIKKDENYSTVKIGYFESKVTEDSTVKLTPVLTYGDVSKTLADFYASEENKHAINFKTPKLVISDHAGWDAAKVDDQVSVKGTVVDVIGKGSSSEGSMYIIDDQGNGYYVYKPTTTGAKTGDVVVVDGKKTIYNGQEEYQSGCSYQVMEKGDASAIPFVNATADWSAATSNTVEGSLANKYQNIPVKLEKCTPTRVAGAYYYFTVDGGKTEFNIYYNTYFLKQEQADAWKATFQDALSKGYTLTIEGISTVYSKAYQVYGSSLKPNVVTKEAELTTEEKHEVVANTLKDAIAPSYKKAATIALPTLPSYATVNSVTVTSPAEAATAVVEDGKIVVTPTPTATTNTVKVNVTIGGVAKDVELTIKTEAKIDPVYYSTEQVAYAAIKVGEATEITAKNSDDLETKVTVLATGVEESKGDWKIGAGDTVLITAPEGYVIDKVEVDSNGDYNSLNFYSSADKAEGTKFDDDTLSDENDKHSNPYRENKDGRTLTTIPVNGGTFLISNDTPSYNVYSKGFVVTLKKQSLLLTESVITPSAANTTAVNLKADSTSSDIAALVNGSDKMLISYIPGNHGSGVRFSTSDVRMYATAGGVGDTLVFESAGDILTVKITFTGDNYATQAKVYAGDSTTEVTPVDGVYTINAKSFRLVNDNTGTSSNVQVRFSKIEVSHYA